MPEPISRWCYIKFRRRKESRPLDLGAASEFYGGRIIPLGVASTAEAGGTVDPSGLFQACLASPKAASHDVGRGLRFPFFHRPCNQFSDGT